jgi:hypothetical protein
MLPGVVDIQKLEVRRQRCVIGPANNYLLDSEGVLIPDSLSPANNCYFRMILKIILKKESRERQASSSKQRLTMVTG